MDEQLSIDEAFNLAVEAQKAGRPVDAGRYYTHVLKLDPQHADAFYNMGVIAASVGKISSSLKFFKRAVNLKPKTERFWLSYAATLIKLGENDEAIKAYNSALIINPKFAEAYYNLGTILLEIGKPEKALVFLEKAVYLKPGLHEAHKNIGNVYVSIGKTAEAIAAFKNAISVKPDYAEAYSNLGLALQGVTFAENNQELQNLILTILNERYARPIDIARSAISLLKFDPKIKNYITNRDYKVLGRSSLAEIMAQLSKIDLLITLLGICPIPDIDFEQFLKNLRASILFSVSSFENDKNLLKFQSALALQCFSNEYIYEQSEAEEKALIKLENKVFSVIVHENQQPNPHLLLCLASYKALNELQFCDLLVSNSKIEEVFVRQVSEPREELELLKTITSSKKIDNHISKIVQKQYESRPYPRWINLGLNRSPCKVSEIIDALNLKLKSNTIRKVNKVDILIAGCGTGQHSIGTAARFSQANILAIDLSLPSLAYAIRKTRELNIKNIEYIQSDILDLDKIDRKFDIIESVGVLHHMEDPLFGWDVLQKCLKPGGLMRIGLYSKLARNNISKIRSEIRNYDIGSTDIEMLTFRKKILISNQKYHTDLQYSNDFYTKSTLRDLIFHVQEKYFTIPELKHSMSVLGLNFCGFENVKIIRNFRRMNPGSGDIYDLDNWQIFEEAYPKTFAGMYQFWCQKES